MELSLIVILSCLFFPVDEELITSQHFQTLLKILNGQLKPLIGEVRRNPAVRLAMVNQHHAEQISLDQSPLEFMVENFPG